MIAQFWMWTWAELSYRSRRFQWTRCQSRLRMIVVFQPASRCSSPSATCSLYGDPSTLRTERLQSEFYLENLHTKLAVKVARSSAIAVLTVVMLSRDNVSGVSDDEVLLRCAVFLIFRFAACTIFATKRDELSLCESRLKAASKLINICWVRRYNSTHVRFWQHFPVGSQPTEALILNRWKLENFCSSVSAADRSRRSIRTVRRRETKVKRIRERIQRLTLLINDSTIWHWCLMSFTTISKESLDLRTIEGPNTIAENEARHSKTLRLKSNFKLT